MTSIKYISDKLYRILSKHLFNIFSCYAINNLKKRLMLQVSKFNTEFKSIKWHCIVFNVYIVYVKIIP